MKKTIFTATTLMLAQFNLEAAVGSSKATSATMPTGIIILISVLSVFLVIGIIWAILHPIRRRRKSAVNIPPPAPRVRVRPRVRPRKRVIIVR